MTDFHKNMLSLATDEEIKGCLIYGQPALEYSKEELVAFLCWMNKEKIEMQNRHHEQTRKLLFGDWGE